MSQRSPSPCILLRSPSPHHSTGVWDSPGLVCDRHPLPLTAPAGASTLHLTGLFSGVSPSLTEAHPLVSPKTGERENHMSLTHSDHVFIHPSNLMVSLCGCEIPGQESFPRPPGPALSGPRPPVPLQEAPRPGFSSEGPFPPCVPECLVLLSAVLTAFSVGTSAL